MRIMIVTDQYPPTVGGVPTVTYGLAHDFANRGHQVWVVAPSQGSRDVRRLEYQVRVYRFSSFQWPTYEGLRIPFLPFVPIRNLLKKIDPKLFTYNYRLCRAIFPNYLQAALPNPSLSPI